LTNKVRTVCTPSGQDAVRFGMIAGTGRFFRRFVPPSRAAVNGPRRYGPILALLLFVSPQGSDKRLPNMRGIHEMFFF